MDTSNHYNGLHLLWEAAFSEEQVDGPSVIVENSTSAELYLSETVIPPVSLNNSIAQTNWPIKRGVPAQKGDMLVASTSMGDSEELSRAGGSSSIKRGVPAQNNQKQLTTPKRRSRKEMDSDTTVRRPKLTRDEETYERLLAVDDINPYQYPPGKECILAWKVALRHSLKNTYQPTEPLITPETEEEIKAQKKKDAAALHSLQVLVDRKIKEFKEKHPSIPPSGIEEDCINKVDQVVESLSEKKDNQPSVPSKAKTDKRSPGAVARDERLIRGMSTGNKSTAPLYSIGDKDITVIESNVALDVRADSEDEADTVNPTKARTKHLPEAKEPGNPAKRAAVAKAYRKVLTKDATGDGEGISEALPSRTNRRLRAADLLQTYNAATTQLESMQDLEKIERQIEVEERKKDREWQQQKFAKEQELKERELEISKEVRLAEAKDRAEDRQILFQTISTLRDVLLGSSKK